MKDSPLAKIVKSAVNLLSFIFAQIYFPTYSNSLKEVVSSLGFMWSHTNLSGPNSIACRLEWERSADSSLKQHLLTYNAEDCNGIEILPGAPLWSCGTQSRLILEKLSVRSSVNRSPFPETAVETALTKTVSISSLRYSTGFSPAFRTTKMTSLKCLPSQHAGAKIGEAVSTHFEKVRSAH
jgi:hypothetical protein